MLSHLLQRYDIFCFYVNIFVALTPFNGNVR